MADKEFTLRSTKTGDTLTVTGKTAIKAAQSEGLNPAIWQEVEPPDQPDEETSG